MNRPGRNQGGLCDGKDAAAGGNLTPVRIAVVLLLTLLLAGCAYLTRHGIPDFLDKPLKPITSRVF